MESDIEQKHKRGHCYVQISTSIPQPQGDVTRLFTKDLFLFLAPKFPRLEIEKYDGQEVGQQIVLKLDFALWKSSWISEITQSWDTPAEWGFEDVGRVLPFPFTYWRHQHKVVANGAIDCRVIDDVQFLAGPLWLSYLLRPLVVGMLAARQPLYKRYFCDPERLNAGKTT